MDVVLCVYIFVIWLVAGWMGVYAWYVCVVPVCAYAQPVCVCVCVCVVHMKDPNSF